MQVKKWKYRKYILNIYKNDNFEFFWVISMDM